MKILFQYFTGGGGGLANIILLLNAIATEHPEDEIDILCSASSGLCQLQQLPNVNIISYGGNHHQEIDRILLGFGGLTKIAAERKTDVIWSLNLGTYLRNAIPQVLSINNSHQVYPWEVTQHHPDNPLHVAALRWFFRRSLRASSGIIVQTPIMAQYVKNIYGAPSQVEVVPKAVENAHDVQPEGLPKEIQKILDDGLGRSAFSFLYVATYTPHKNHKVIIDALDILASEGCKVRLLLSITPDELFKCGGDKARRLAQNGHLLPVGWINKRHLKAFYDACDACLMPSLLESLSSAHLEAMQWEKPQIAADLPYAQDLCGNAALYVPAEEPVAWVAAIKKLCADEVLRTKLIIAGQERMLLFPKTWSEAARKVHSFLETIVASPNGQRRS